MTEINIQDVLEALRETIATQAQEIAVLRATVKALSTEEGDKK